MVNRAHRQKVKYISLSVYKNPISISQFLFTFLQVKRQLPLSPFGKHQPPLPLPPNLPNLPSLPNLSNLPNLSGFSPPSPAGSPSSPHAFLASPDGSTGASEARKRAPRALTGRHVKSGPGASPRTLAILRKKIEERVRLKELLGENSHLYFGALNKQKGKKQNLPRPQLHQLVPRF